MRWCKLLLVGMLFLNLIGCATSKKDITSLQVEELKMRISELETELELKNEEICYLEDQLIRTQREKAFSAKKRTAKPKSSISQTSSKNIQIALKNAGFYKGPIDGRIGKETKKAIKEFQKANGLTTDGIVGKQTRLRLKKYLN